MGSDGGQDSVDQGRNLRYDSLFLVYLVVALAAAAAAAAPALVLAIEAEGVVPLHQYVVVVLVRGPVPVAVVDRKPWR